MVLFLIFCKTSDILFGPPSTHKPININEQIKMNGGQHLQQFYGV